MIFETKSFTIKSAVSDKHARLKHSIDWIERAVSKTWPFYYVQHGRQPPSWIFAEVKYEGISVSETFVFVFQPNFVRMCAIATELLPLK